MNDDVINIIREMVTNENPPMMMITLIIWKWLACNLLLVQQQNRKMLWLPNQELLPMPMSHMYIVIFMIIHGYTYIYVHYNCVFIYIRNIP